VTAVATDRAAPTRPAPARLRPERAAPVALNPAQQSVRDQLGSAGGDPPEFPSDLGPALEADLAAGLAPLLDELGDGSVLIIAKHGLAQVHGCEARYLHQRDDPFTVSVPVARGTVAHKAIELAVHWPVEPNPLDLVDEALARLQATDHWLADWLATASDVDRAELRSEAGDRVSKFLECFPPLRPSWRPVTESSLRVELFGGRIQLKGKVDLTIGHAVGTTAGKVIVDLKTGRPAPAHTDDLRFYALVETIRIGVPPRLVASYYLDQARSHTERVTIPLLEAALARTVDGARRMVALHDGAVAVKRPSPACRWCALLPDCAEGTAMVHELDGLD
jgi:CRISPR/Cas system-associated exonuclease Cas4 (RecB family)